MFDEVRVHTDTQEVHVMMMFAWKAGNMLEESFS